MTGVEAEVTHRTDLFRSTHQRSPRSAAITSVLADLTTARWLT